ncbi:MAG: hypothetical protein HY075_12230 [Deltaproteobacteria bacterium]|nr:hypothetical protein [Deltaproteobacteria bacterium]
MTAIYRTFLLLLVACAAVPGARAHADCPRPTVRVPIVARSWRDFGELMCKYGASLGDAHDLRLRRLRERAAPYLGRQLRALESFRDKNLADSEVHRRVAEYNVERKRISESAQSAGRKEDLRNDLDWALYPFLRKRIGAGITAFRSLKPAPATDADRTDVLSTSFEAPWFFLLDKVERANVVACTTLRLDEDEAGELSMCSSLDLETGAISGTDFDGAVREPEAIKKYDDYRELRRFRAARPAPPKPYYRMTRDEYVRSATRGLAPAFCY